MPKHKISLNFSILLLLIPLILKTQNTKKEYPFSLKSGDIIKLQVLNTAQIIFGMQDQNNNFMLAAKTPDKIDHKKNYQLFKIEKKSKDTFNVQDDIKTIFDGDTVQFTLVSNLNQGSASKRLCTISKLRRGNLQQYLALLSQIDFEKFKKNKNITINSNFIVKQQADNKNAIYKPIFPGEHTQIVDAASKKNLIIKSNEIKIGNNDSNSSPTIFKINKLTKQEVWNYFNPTPNLTTQNTAPKISTQIRQSESQNIISQLKETQNKDGQKQIEKYRQIAQKVNLNTSKKEKLFFIEKLKKTLQNKINETNAIKEILKSVIL